MSVIINPGTEPRPGTEANAWEAMRRFRDALDLDLAIERVPARDSDGYWAFLLVGLGVTIDVDMPGVDPDVTELGVPWTSPRLYIDGLSWWWATALNRAADKLGVSL